MLASRASMVIQRAPRMLHASVGASVGARAALSTSVGRRAVLSGADADGLAGASSTGKRGNGKKEESTGGSTKKAAGAQLEAEQRRVLADLRAAAALGKRSGGDVVRGLRDEAVLRGVARAALQDATPGAGPATMGMLGGTAANMPHTRPSRLDRWTGAGRSWSDISAGQKAARGAVNTSRITFIAGGALFTVLVTWAIVTELFAANSPTVVYEDACKLVRKSEDVHAYLLPPYTFYTSETELAPDSGLPVGRGRVRAVTSQVAMDQTGEEVMRVRFVMHARDKDTDLTWVQAARASVYAGAGWARDRLLDTWDDARDWYDDTVAAHAADEQRRLAALDAKAQRHASAAVWDAQDARLAAAHPDTDRWYHTPGRWLGGAMAGFVGLTRGASGAVGSAARAQDAGTWTTGEVHGELRKDEKGTFQFTKLFVDVPNSDAFSRRRAWIVRHKGEIRR